MMICVMRKQMGLECICIGDVNTLLQHKMEYEPLVLIAIVPALLSRAKWLSNFGHFSTGWTEQSRFSIKFSFWSNMHPPCQPQRMSKPMKKYEEYQESHGAPICRTEGARGGEQDQNENNKSTNNTASTAHGNRSIVVWRSENKQTDNVRREHRGCHPPFGMHALALRNKVWSEHTHSLLQCVRRIAGCARLNFDFPFSCSFGLFLRPSPLLF